MDLSRASHQSWSHSRFGAGGPVSKVAAAKPPCSSVMTGHAGGPSSAARLGQTAPAKELCKETLPEGQNRKPGDYLKVWAAPRQYAEWQFLTCLTLQTPAVSFMSKTHLFFPPPALPPLWQRLLDAPGEEDQAPRGHLLRSGCARAHPARVRCVLPTQTYCRVHFQSIILQSKIILAQLPLLLTRSGLSGQQGKLLGGSGLSPRCRLMPRRKLNRTGIWVSFKGKVKSLGGAYAQLLQISRSSQNDVTADRALSARLNDSRLSSRKSSGGDLRSRGLLLPLRFLALVVVSLRNSKPIQIILAANTTYVVYMVNHFKDYVGIAASSRTIF
ncbi:uncharacterized protein LOC121099588 isoform X1 [Falco naumanni]|uniref:uncharacterized protein LOC121099588 isoform X1 n=1 Tax=Falco naumanni TaxID=148594 RepID=UPI001ADE9D6C|nr:uncharacterized protein LOC121099588 isoform X1 [Falco naumanni]